MMSYTECAPMGVTAPGTADIFPRGWFTNDHEHVL